MKGLKIVGWVLVVLVILLAIGITATIGWKPFFGPSARALTDRRFESTPERLERGKYLTENVTPCFGCHSPRDWSKNESPEAQGMHGAGMANFPFEGLPGTVHAPNITPDKETGAGNWTDDQMARAIREGIGFDGRALFPMMPYENFRRLSDEDLASIIVYSANDPAGETAGSEDRVDLPREEPDQECARADHGAGAGTQSVHAREARRVPGDDRRCAATATR